MLSKQQKRTLEFIKSYIQENEISPTTLEVAHGIGIQSKGVAHRYIQALEQAGYIKCLAHRKRNLQLIENSQINPLKIPLLGTIAAGQPIEAIVDSDYIHLTELFTDSQCYALKVKGDSMIDEGIFDGDVILCEASETATNGDIVVALIDNHAATLKRLHNNLDGTITLKPANLKLQAMTYAAEQVKIQGKFRGLIRQ